MVKLVMWSSMTLGIKQKVAGFNQRPTSMV